LEYPLISQTHTESKQASALLVRSPALKQTNNNSGALYGRDIRKRKNIYGGAGLNFCTQRGPWLNANSNCYYYNNCCALGAAHNMCTLGGPEFAPCLDRPPPPASFRSTHSIPLYPFVQYTHLTTRPHFSGRRRLLVARHRTHTQTRIMCVRIFFRAAVERVDFITSHNNRQRRRCDFDARLIEKQARLLHANP
jgi:hypothetical protein